MARKTKKLNLSVVLPCYKESEHIDESIKRIVETLENTKLKYEIILIDDKSPDDTPKHLKKISKTYKNVRVYYHKINLGRGGTVMDGISKAKAPIVGFIDIDLEVIPDYIPHIVKLLQNNKADVIIGHRHYPFEFWPLDHLLRVILSKGYNFMVARFLYLPVHDTESGYKFFVKEKILPVISQINNQRWFWDTEISTRALMYGLKVIEVPVLFLRNPDKTSTVNLVPDTIDYFKEIFKFKRNLNTNKKVSSKIGLLYKSSTIYSYAMKFLYKDSYDDSYKEIANLIPKNSSVVDLCCGDAMLFNFLKVKQVEYLGIDGSQAFINNALKKNIRIRLSDVSKDEIPKSDYIIMQRSLYQFDNPSLLVKKMLKSAKRGVIISESVHNLHESFFGKTINTAIPLFVGTNTKNSAFRFSETGLKKILSKYTPKYVKTKGGRDLIALIKK